MAYFVNASRTIVIRASRETIGLIVAASAMTFAVAYAVHSKPAPSAPVAQQQDWTGHLAEIAPQPEAVTPMSSADLVVPKSQLALPSVPVRPQVKRACEDASCAKVPVPPRRAVARADGSHGEPHEKTQDGNVLASLNPLHHIPTISTIGRPFVYAGNVVSGWIKRF